MFQVIWFLHTAALGQGGGGLLAPSSSGASWYLPNGPPLPQTPTPTGRWVGCADAWTMPENHSCCVVETSRQHRQCLNTHINTHTHSHSHIWSQFHGHSPTGMHLFVLRMHFPQSIDGAFMLNLAVFDLSSGDT